MSDTFNPEPYPPDSLTPPQVAQSFEACKPQTITVRILPRNLKWAPGPNQELMEEYGDAIRAVENFIDHMRDDLDIAFVDANGNDSISKNLIVREYIKRNHLREYYGIDYVEWERENAAMFQAIADGWEADRAEDLASAGRSEGEAQ